jgi:hypothetical protein
MAKNEKSSISGKEAAYIAMEAMKYPPVHISEADNSAQGSNEVEVAANLPTLAKKYGAVDAKRAPSRQLTRH